MTVLVDREAKKKLVSVYRRDDAKHGWSMEGYDFVASNGWESPMNNTHLLRLSAQVLNEKQVEPFDEFLHREGQ